MVWCGFMRVFIAAAALIAFAQQPPPMDPAAGRGRQGGPNVGRFAGQTPINAMVGTGGPFHVVWTHDYRGTRVFGTTLGHGNETFHTNQFKELLTRGFRWALKKEPIALPPPPPRGGGAGRGGGG